MAVDICLVLKPDFQQFGATTYIFKLNCLKEIFVHALLVTHMHTYLIDICYIKF